MLITLQEAKGHLRVDHDDSDADILLKIGAVSELVLAYIKAPVDAYPLDTSGIAIGVPYRFKQAALIWLGILFKDRDGQTSTPLEFGEIPRTVSNLLVMDRLPTVA